MMVFVLCLSPVLSFRQIGTDIQDNKCGWLVVQALLRADDKQKATLKACNALLLTLDDQSATIPFHARLRSTTVAMTTPRWPS